MTKVSSKIGVTTAAIALVVGLVGGWGVGRFQGYRDLRVLALAHELEATGLCANGLKLEATESPERLVMLLEQRLDSAVRYASDLVDAGARLSSGSPSLKDSVRRAADYYATKDDTTKKQMAETLLARLNTDR